MYVHSLYSLRLLIEVLGDRRPGFGAACRAFESYLFFHSDFIQKLEEFISQ